MTRAKKIACVVAIIAAVIGTGAVVMLPPLISVSTVGRTRLFHKNAVVLAEPTSLVLIGDSNEVTRRERNEIADRIKEAYGFYNIVYYRFPLGRWWLNTYVGTILTFGTGWREATGLGSPAYTIVAVFPKGTPPQPSEGSHFLVVLSPSERDNDTNAVWQQWCERNHVPFAYAQAISTDGIFSVISSLDVAAHHRDAANH